MFKSFNYLYTIPKIKIILPLIECKIYIFCLILTYFIKFLSKAKDNLLLYSELFFEYLTNFITIDKKNHRFM